MTKRVLAAALCCLIALAGAVSSAGAEIPKGVFYEVYVRAFADSDGDGIGDLKGLTAKLDYLNDGDPSTYDDLGVTGLWLMPVFEAKSDHGYDTTDYYTIDPDYGTNEDMRVLLEEAHKRGVSVIVDLVLNHTSSDHPWFQNALDGGEKRDWYRFFQEGVDDPALLRAAPLGGPAWHESRGGTYCGLFWEGMPDLNLDNPEVEAELRAIARYWLAMGVDGFRLDATSHFFGFGEDVLEQQTAKSGQWLRAFTDDLKADYPDVYIVGEAWEDQQKRADILFGVDSVFNFDVGKRLVSRLTNGVDANRFPREIEKYTAECTAANPLFWDAPFLTNHDQERILTQLGGDESAYRLLAGIVLTLPGNPFLYYGEELGMQGRKPDEQLRTPMLWGGGDAAQCTFVASQYNDGTAPVSAQLAQDDSLLRTLIGLIATRNRCDALRLGSLTALDTDNRSLMAYRMTYGEQSVLVFHNLHATEAQPLTLGSGAVSPDASVLYGTRQNGTIPARSTLVLAD